MSNRIAEISQEVISFWESHKAELDQWYSEQVYAGLLMREKDTLLVRMGQGMDLEEMEKACAGYRRNVGKRGQESTYTIGQLVRMLVAKNLHSWSLRVCASKIATDQLLRWFCGFGLGEKTPDHTTLERFEQWVIAHYPRSLFDLSLQQIDKEFPEEQEAIQFGDTFALHSLSADLTLDQLLRRMGLRLWQSYRALLPADRLPTPQAQAIYTIALDPERQKADFGLSSQERDTQTLTCAQQICPLPALLAQTVKGLNSPDPEPLADFHRWRQRLEKVLADECWLEQDDQGTLSASRLRTAKERGSYRLLTPVDPDISLRVHDDDVARGYNVSIATTTHFVREIQAATGSTPDSVGVEKLIAAQWEHQGVVPPKLVYDQAAGTPKKIADVAKASHNRTQLVVRLVDYQRKRIRFGPLDFSLDEQGVLTCPNGQQSSRAYRSNSADGWNYRFLPDQCQDCPLMDKCRGDAVKPGSYRQVFISSYQSQQRAAIAYQQSDTFAAEMKMRSNVERMIAALVRYNGARYAQRNGLANANYQMKMAGMAYNLKHWLVLVLAREKAQRVQTASP